MTADIPHYNQGPHNVGCIGVRHVTDPMMEQINGYNNADVNLALHFAILEGKKGEACSVDYLLDKNYTSQPIRGCAVVRCNAAT